MRKEGSRHSRSLQASDTLERRLYVRSSQIPDCPNEKQCPQSGADYRNRALGHSNFAWNEKQLYNAGYDSEATGPAFHSQQCDAQNDSDDEVPHR